MELPRFMYDKITVSQPSRAYRVVLNMVDLLVFQYLTQF